MADDDDDEAETEAALEASLRACSLEELKQFCSVTHKALDIGITVFRSRFPAEFAALDRIEN